MIGTVDCISLSYSCLPWVLSLEKVLDCWFPNLLGKARRMQEDQRQVLIGSAISLMCCDAVMVNRVALGCDVVRIRWSRGADDGVHEHRRGRGEGGPSQCLGNKRHREVGPSPQCTSTAPSRLRSEPVTLSRLGTRLRPPRDGAEFRRPASVSQGST